jgi:hypothetical protein
VNLRNQKVSKEYQRFEAVKDDRVPFSQFSHPSSSPNSEEHTAWSAWPQHWCRPSSQFLP